MKKLCFILFSMVSAKLVNVEQLDLKTPLNQFVRKSSEVSLLADHSRNCSLNVADPVVAVHC
jgi:hypothetical protein